MQFQERYDFLKTAIARYDGYYNLAAVKASLLLTSNAVLLAPGLGEQSQFLRIAGNTGASRALVGGISLRVAGRRVKLRSLSTPRTSSDRASSYVG